MSRRGVLRCLLAAVFFGLSAPAASRLAHDLGPFTLAGLLYVGAAIATFVPNLRHPPTRQSLQRAVPRLSAAVILGGAIGPLLLAAGLQHTSAATTSLLLNLELVFTAAFAGIVLHEHLGRRVITGAVLVVVAGATLGWAGTPDTRWGAVLIIGACGCWGIDNGITAALDSLAPATITFAKGLFAGTANLAIGLAVDGIPPRALVVKAVAVGMVGYGASITLWVAGARDLGAARGQLVFAAAPFIGAIASWTAFAEPVTGRQVLALLIAASGVTFVLGSGHEHPHTHEALDHEHEHASDDGHHQHDDPPHGRHLHHHTHMALVHSHPHVPDLHHRHNH